MTIAGRLGNRGSIEWYEAVLTLEDGRGVRLAKACPEDDASRFCQEILALLNEPERDWWNWGKPPGVKAVTVKERPGWAEVTFQPVPAWKFGNEYWLGVEFMSLPLAVGMLLVICLLSSKGVMQRGKSNLPPMVAAGFLFVGFTFVLVWIGSALLRTAFKRAQTMVVVTCDAESLAIRSVFKGKTDLQRFSAGEIALIRREVFGEPALKRVPLTVELITHEALARARGEELPAICEECGYDMRHSPKVCPECGTTAGRVKRSEPVPVTPVAIIKCRTPLEASWLERRLNRWHDEVKGKQK